LYNSMFLTFVGMMGRVCGGRRPCLFHNIIRESFEKIA
jgi:hypothetical protein